MFGFAILKTFVGRVGKTFFALVKRLDGRGTRNSFLAIVLRVDAILRCLNVGIILLTPLYEAPLFLFAALTVENISETRLMPLAFFRHRSVFLRLTLTSALAVL